MNDYISRVRRLCRDRLARYKPDCKIIEVSKEHYCIIPKDADLKTFDTKQSYVFTPETLLDYTEELKRNAEEYRKGHRG